MARAAHPWDYDPHGRIFHARDADQATRSLVLWLVILAAAIVLAIVAYVSMRP